MCKQFDDVISCFIPVVNELYSTLSRSYKDATVKICSWRRQGLTFIVQVNRHGRSGTRLCGLAVTMISQPHDLRTHNSKWRQLQATMRGGRLQLLLSKAQAQHVAGLELTELVTSSLPGPSSSYSTTHRPHELRAWRYSTCDSFSKRVSRV